MIFNVLKIFKDNYTLLIEESSKFHVYFWLFIVPLTISIVITLCGFRSDDNQLSNTISFISIIVGFLINASVILISTEISKGSIGDVLKNRSHANIFYTILVGILIILLIIVKPSFEHSIFEQLLKISFTIPIINILLDISVVYYIILYALFIHFIVMILVIIKAFYALYK